jgi:hypothetical protein
VTIKLFDVEEQKRFREELETYNTRVEEASKDGMPLGADWPAYPKPVEPFADSKDEGFRASDLPPSTSPSNAYSRPYVTPRDLDFMGTSQSEVKGFESGWAKDDEGKRVKGLPFSIKKG